MKRKPASAPSAEEKRACLHCHLGPILQQRFDQGLDDHRSAVTALVNVIADLVSGLPDQDRARALHWINSALPRLISRNLTPDMEDARIGHRMN